MEKLKSRELVKEAEVMISSLIGEQSLKIASNYNYVNALKAAALILNDTVDKNKVPVLQCCTKTSILNALFTMVMQGLDPLRKQCAFIAFGDKLVVMRTYYGNLALAKRAGLRYINANVVYNDDTFSYGVRADGSLYIHQHNSALKNIGAQIIAAYAVYGIADQYDNKIIHDNMVLMTIEQIKQAWSQGVVFKEGTTSVFTKFPEEMCKKTVINRACKIIINSAGYDDFEIEEYSDIKNIDNNLNILNFEEEEEKEEEKSKEKEEEKKENNEKPPF